MSITQHPTEAGESRHPHLGLVVSNDDRIASPDGTGERQACPARRSFGEYLIFGFAVAGTAMYATPDSLRV